MKRILLVLLALTLVAGFSTAYAQEDGTLVKFSGTMKVKGYYDENLDGSANWDNDDPRDEREFWRQRFRLYTIFTPAEGVSAHLRLDYSERDWGDQQGSGRPTDGFDAMHVDRAFLELDRELFRIRGGQQGAFWGVSIPVDYQFTGWTFTLKTPVKVELLYGKNDENGERSDADWNAADPWGDSGAEDDTTGDDDTTYALQVSYASEMFSIGSILGTRQDRTTLDMDDDLEMWSIWATANFGMFSFATELDVFGGEIEQGPGVEDIDYVGTQFYFMASVKLSDVFQVDGEFFYAAGTDEGAEADVQEETQVTDLHDWGSWIPQSMIHLDGEYNPLMSQNGAWAIFEPWNDSGVVGAILSVEFTAMPGLKLLAQTGYVTAEDEDLRGMDYDKHWEDGWFVAAGLSWSFMEAATLDLGAYWGENSFSGDDDDPRNATGGDGDATGHGHDDDTEDDPDDDAWGLIGILTVAF